MNADRRGERLAAFRHEGMEHLPDVRHGGPHGQFDPHAGGAGPRGQFRGIVAQGLIGAHVNQQRRQAAQIGIQRGGQRVARIAAGVRHVEFRGARQAAAMEHGATPVVDAARFADAHQVGQRREQGRGGGQRGAFRRAA
jgi:hypothetical protein